MNPTKPKYKYGDTVKNIDGTVAGSAVFDPDTGNPLTGAGAFNPNTGDAIKNVITPDLLKGTPQIPLPKENLTNPVADKVLSIADTAVEGAKTEAGTSQENYVKALKDVMTTTDKLGTYEDQAGVKQAEKTSQNLANQVTSLVRNFSAFRQEVNNDPMIVGAVKDRRVSAEQTRVANTVADLQFTKSLVDQNLTEARKWAKDKVDLELRPLELEVENKKFVRDNAQQFFTATQMKRLDSQIKQEEDKIADMREQKKKNLEMYTQASLQEAPPDLLTRAKEAIDEGKGTSEVVGILGKYAGDIYKTELLKEQIKTEKAQRANIYNTISNRNADNARQNAAASNGTVLGADGKPLKALSGEASKLLAISSGLETNAQKIKNKITAVGYDKFLRGYILGTDRETVKLLSNAADQLGRLRSGGAINKEEEKRFLAQFASRGDYAFGNANIANDSIDSILTEARTVRSGLDPQGSYSTSTSSVNNPFANALGKTETIQGTSIIEKADNKGFDFKLPVTVLSK